ncbi:MAG: transporter substrate-binding domain-containing protein [Candidatus Cloacimonetes bacterium]|nr:transporter substrate-binding domain-containing protein [Candidatus Cloacimonadota bacterium]
MKKFWNNVVLWVAVLLFILIGLNNTHCYCAETEQIDLQIITEDLAPFNFRSADGTITGQSTEVVQEILSRLGLDIEIQLMPWNVGYERALKESDVALYSTFRTDERENLFQWVGPIASDEILFYTVKGSDIVIRSLEDAKSLSAIAVVKDDARHQLLEKNNVKNLKLYPSDAECYRALANGDVAAVLGSNNTMLKMAQQAGVDPSKMVAVYSVRKTPLYVAFSKAIPVNVVQEWQNVLDEIKRDGTFNKINQKWGGSVEKNIQTKIPKNGISIPSAVKLLAGFIDYRIEGFLSSLHLLTLTNEVLSGKWKKMKTLLMEQEQAEPSGRIWYLLPDGSYYTTVDDLTSKNLKDRSYFPDLIAGNPVHGSIVVSKSTGKPVAVVASPIFKKGKVIGALGTSIYMQNINEEVQNTFPLGMPYKFFAVSPEGIIALHSDDEWIGQNIEHISKDLKHIFITDSGEISYTSEGNQWNATWSTAPSTGWRIVISKVDD